MPAFFVETHTSVLADTKSSAEDFDEVSVDDDVAEREVSTRHFSPRICRREKVWLGILQVSNVQYSLCAALRKHGNDLVKFPNTKKLQHRSGLGTVSGVTFGDFSAINLCPVAADPEKARFSKNKFSLSAIGDRHLCALQNLLILISGARNELRGSFG